jgi:hypothetical protein
MLAKGLLRPFVIFTVLIVIMVLALYGWPVIPLGTSAGFPQPIGHPHSGHPEAGYREIFSMSTPDGKYFTVDFSPRRGINPNAIPHPTLEHHWVIVGQLDDHRLGNSVWFAELECTATFKGGVLSCIDPPLVLSIGRRP